MQKRSYLYVLTLVFGSVWLPVATGQELGPLLEISRPNAVGSCNDGFSLFGTWPIDEAEEPFVAVNPIHPNNVVVAWIQGNFQDIVSAASFDGGQSWKQVPVPLTICSGGPYLGTGDPWLSFAPNGDLYAVAIAGNTNSDRGVMVTKSIDGGLHWSSTLLPESVTVPMADQPHITADPANALAVYAIWGGASSKYTRAGVFTRTTDGGATWEAPRVIIQTTPHTYIQFSQILVLPNGTLLYMFEYYEQQPNKPITFTNIQIKRSTDQGETWSSPFNAVTMTPLYAPTGNTLLVDPETGQSVYDVTNPSFAVDSQTGNVYAVWEDGRFSNFQYNDIAFSMSADGGSTWSTPIRVNQTPLNIAVPNRQSFFPSIAVTGSGEIGVSYYDFRFNDPSPGWSTDRWLVQCSPTSVNSPANAACWGNEVRLTDNSFNMEAVVPTESNAFFLGDYFGLAAGKSFQAVFTQPDQANVTSIFARQVEP